MPRPKRSNAKDYEHPYDCGVECRRCWDCTLKTFKVKQGTSDIELYLLWKFCGSRMIKGAFGVWEGSGVSSLTRAKWLQSARKPSIPCQRVGGTMIRIVSRNQDQGHFIEIGIRRIERNQEDQEVIHPSWERMGKWNGWSEKSGSNPSCRKSERERGEV